MAVFFLFFFIEPDKLDVTISVSEESRLIEMEFTRSWTPRTSQDAEACSQWKGRRDAILFHWNITFIDKYHPDHPGYPAAKWGKHRKWERLSQDWWIRTGAPIEWMEWNLKCWLQEHRRAEGWGETFGAAIQNYDDPERVPLPPPPWHPGFWEIHKEYGP